MMAVEQRLKQALSRRQKRHIVDTHREPSAVLLPVYRKQDDYYLLFTKRTQQVKAHRGQVSFPGGAYQEEDNSLLDTALRECAEEIGLAPERVEILGELDDAITQNSNYVITPFVGVIPWPYDFRINIGEIEEIVEVPLSAIMDRSRWRQETERIAGEETPVYFFNYQGRVIWGATARILNQFVGIIRPILGKS